ncbi:MAG: AI-2E family transporter [Acidobacteria bacterium]|nr:AI-2E family transporter [Acidobacteriota bacterium]
MARDATIALNGIAFGVAMAICYFAGSVIQTILVSVLLALLLEPGVEKLRRWRFPRPLAVLTMLLLLIAAVSASSFFLYSSAEEFMEELPGYSQTLRRKVLQIRSGAERMQRQTEQVIPPPRERVAMVETVEPSFWSRRFFPGSERIFNFILLVSYIPFLIFFLLTWKDRMYQRYLSELPEQDRPRVAGTLHAISKTLRGFLIGNFLVGLMLAAMSALFFAFLQLKFAIFIGIMSGFLNLIPYVGVLLAMIPPLLVAFEQAQNTPLLFILGGGISVFHLVGLNVLYPKIVGPRANLNPFAIMVALLVWSWMWGLLGFILAIPIAAGAKVLCDNTPSLRGVGRLLGD